MPEAQAQDARVQKEVRTERLVVVDSKGNPGIVMGAGIFKSAGGSFDGAFITLVDGSATSLDESKSGMFLTATRRGPVFGIQTSGKIRALLKADSEENVTALTLYDGKQNAFREGVCPIISLQVEPGGKGGVGVGTPDATKYRAFMTAFETGVLGLFDKSGKTVWKAP
jgi:hypothetical protein